MVVWHSMTGPLRRRGVTHGPECFQGAGDACWVFQQPGGIFFELYECFDGAECIAEDETGSVESSEQVAGHGEAATANVFEQQSRSASFADSPMNLCRFQIGVDFAGNSQQLAVFFQISEAFLQISVTHRYGSVEMGVWERNGQRHHRRKRLAGHRGPSAFPQNGGMVHRFQWNFRGTVDSLQTNTGIWRAEGAIIRGLAALRIDRKTGTIFVDNDSWHRLIGTIFQIGRQPQQRSGCWGVLIFRLCWRCRS